MWLQVWKYSSLCGLFKVQWSIWPQGQNIMANLALYLYIFNESVLSLVESGIGFLTIKTLSQPKWLPDRNRNTKEMQTEQIESNNRNKRVKNLSWFRHENALHPDAEAFRKSSRNEFKITAIPSLLHLAMNQ